jgi:N-acyl homoserine lactone hydrolase
VPTPGHTPTHVSVIVRDGDEQIILAGDASYLEATMLRGTVDGVSPDEASAKTTLADIGALCAASPTIYLPTHDPQTGERLAQRRPVGASNHTSSDREPAARPIDRRSAIPI